MIDGRKVLALVPARSGSKGLPGKNVRQLLGKPLLAWPIMAAKGSCYVDKVILSTDSGEFAILAENAGADVPFLRPKELANDTSPSISFILHALDTLETRGEKYDYLLLLEPTSPLTESSDIDAALELLLAKKDVADSIVGIAELVSAHPAFAVRKGGDGTLTPYASGNFAQLPRRQDVEKIYSLDGSLYISTVDALRRAGGFCHERTIGFVMPHYKSFEVDDIVDFVCIEAILAQMEVIKSLQG